MKNFSLPKIKVYQEEITTRPRAQAAVTPEGFLEAPAFEERPTLALGVSQRHEGTNTQARQGQPTQDPEASEQKASD